MVPSGSQRPRSPVLYIRASGLGLKGSVTKRSAVTQDGQITPCHARSADIELACHTNGYGLTLTIEYVDLRVRDGAADGRLHLRASWLTPCGI